MSIRCLWLSFLGSLLLVSPAFAAPTTRTVAMSEDFSITHAVIQVHLRGKHRGAVYVDYTNQRLRVDHDARGSRPAATMWAFYNNNNLFVASDGECVQLESLRARPGWSRSVGPRARLRTLLLCSTCEGAREPVRLRP